MTYEIDYRDLHPQRIVSTRRRAGLDELPNVIGTSINALRVEVGAEHLHGPEAAFVIYHEKIDREHDGDIEICLAAPPSYHGGLYPLRDLPAVHAAVTTVPASANHYPEILEAFEAVANAIIGQGKMLGESPREFYATDGSGRFEIAWPMAESGAAIPARPA